MNKQRLYRYHDTFPMTRPIGGQHTSQKYVSPYKHKAFIRRGILNTQLRLNVDLVIYNRYLTDFQVIISPEIVNKYLETFLEIRFLSYLTFTLLSQQ